jgi:hypothetical protein
VFVQAGSQVSGSAILEVLATETTMLPPSPVTVNVAATTTGVDIYVPPPAGSVNATMIGIGDAGTSISLSGSSVEVTRGQTKQLVLGGTGMNQASGTTVSISGGGITISSVQFQSTFVFVNFSVAATATTGARNVIVTNSNLDRTVFSGGLFIR